MLQVFLESPLLQEEALRGLGIKSSVLASHGSRAHHYKSQDLGTLSSIKEMAFEGCVVPA